MQICLRYVRYILTMLARSHTIAENFIGLVIEAGARISASNCDEMQVW